MTDQEFLAAFEALELDPAAFSHDGHLRAAWILLSRYPNHDACGRFITLLKRFASHHGAPGKYHETLTLFFLDALACRIAAGKPAGCWRDFRDENPVLCGDFRAVIDAHYEPETLASDYAREHFVLPDRAPGNWREAWQS